MRGKPLWWSSMGLNSRCQYQLLGFLMKRSSFSEINIFIQTHTLIHHLAKFGGFHGVFASRRFWADVPWRAIWGRLWSWWPHVLAAAIERNLTRSCDCRCPMLSVLGMNSMKSWESKGILRFLSHDNINLEQMLSKLSDVLYLPLNFHDIPPIPTQIGDPSHSFRSSTSIW